MDHIDEQLLAAMTENAREPVKTVAEKAGVSREVADYRLKKFREVIRGYARLNTAAAHSSYIMFLDITFVSGDAEGGNSLLRFLRDTKYPHWIGRASGNWDVLFLFSIKHISELHEFTERVKEFLGGTLNRSMLLQVTAELNDSMAGLFGGEERLTNRVDCELPELDGTDRRILSMLTEDVENTNKQMAEEVGLTAEAVRYRLGKLEETWIVNYRSVVDLEKLGFMRFALISEEAPRARQQVYSCSTLSGNFSILAVKSLEELNDCMNGYEKAEILPIYDFSYEAPLSLLG